LRQITRVSVYWIHLISKNMKRIIEYRKMFNATKDTDLGQLKKTYRNLVKEWHPDKYQEGDPKLKEAELKSQEIIEAYTFLVSIAPETHAQNASEYAETTTASGIEDYQYKGVNLKVTFQNGNVYEYYGVPRSVYNKLNSSPTIDRFARRHIFHSHTYRKVMKGTEE
jgi:molecular chaperone HscB